MQTRKRGRRLFANDLNRIAVGSGADALLEMLFLAFPHVRLDGAPGEEPGQRGPKQMQFAHDGLLGREFSLVGIGPGQEIEDGSAFLAALAEIASQKLAPGRITIVGLVIGKVM